jgi:hypothetical protein
MSRRAQKITQGDITRAAKGAAKAGLTVQHMEIDLERRIIRITGEAPPSAANDDLDQELAEFIHAKG